MKVGTDGVLLGAWTDTRDAATILDVGTGTGLIALMMAQKTKEAQIEAIEIEAEAANQAMENVAASPWSERINVHNTSFQDFARQCRKKYELIASNPPFFSNSLAPPSKTRTLARHDVKLNPETLLFLVNKILSPNGRLSVIIPEQNRNMFIRTAFINDLHPSRIHAIKPAAANKVNRLLMEFSRIKNISPREEVLMIKNENNTDYSSEYKELTRQFYINF